MSLNTLVNRLSEVGQREDALAAAQEAVDLRRSLATAHPDIFTPNLALSLDNLANRLSDLGQRENALTAAQEASVRALRSPGGRARSRPASRRRGRRR